MAEAAEEVRAWTERVIATAEDATDPLAAIWQHLTDETPAQLEAARRALLLAELLGRVAVDHEGGNALSAITSLPFEEAIAWFRAKRIVTEAEFKRLDAAAKQRALSIAGLNSQFGLTEAHRAIAEALEQGTAQRQAVGQLRDLFAACGLTGKKHHLDVVFRTNVLGSYASGRWAQLQRVKRRRPWWRYRTVGDERVRPAHRAMDGKIFRHDDPVWGRWYPPNGFQCFLPGTVVSGSIVAGLKAWYSGPAVEVETARGVRLSVTANHPIATSKGWRAAHELEEGDTLLCDRRRVEFASPPRLPLDTAGDVAVEHGPSCVEDVFEALRLAGPVAAGHVSALDLHGDGRCVEGEIEVVRAERNLSIDGKPKALDRVGDGDLVGADALASRSCNLREMLIAVDAPSRGGPGGATLLRDAVHGVWSALYRGPLQPLGFGTSAEFDAVALEKTTDGRPAEPDFFGKLLQACPGDVAPDEVARISHFDFHGHVFDLQTVSGWIMASNVVTSNCRCSVESLSDADMEREGRTPDDALPELNGRPVEPDRGWATSPGSDASARKAVDAALRKAQSHRVLRAPKFAKRGARPYADAGDIGPGDESRKRSVLRTAAGLTDREIGVRLGRGRFAMEKVPKLAAGTAEARIPIPSQYADALEQLATDATANPDTAHLAKRLRIDARAWFDPRAADPVRAEVVKIAGGHGGTDLVVGLSGKAADAELLAQVAARAQAGTPGAVRRAVPVTDAIVRGAKTVPAGWRRAVLNTKGNEARLTRAPLRGYLNEDVIVTDAKWEDIP